MRIFDETKTIELKETEQLVGKLVEDILIINHPKVEEVKEVGHYETIAEYPNGGKDVIWVVDVEGIQGKEAYTEEEKILVFIPYTEEEIRENKIKELRSRRKILLEAFDKWEKAVLRGREIEDHAIMQWYQDLLDLKESAFEEVNIPERIKYYI